MTEQEIQKLIADHTALLRSIYSSSPPVVGCSCQFNYTTFRGTMLFFYSVFALL